MAFSSEISGRLGIDSSSVPADMQKARGAFNQSADKLTEDAGKHGDNAGAKLVGGIEHRLFGARHLATALATALGLNIEHIAETITGGIVGGSKEAWKQAVEIADAQTKIIERMIELRMNPTQVEERHKRNLQRTMEQPDPTGEIADAQAARAVRPVGPMGGAYQWIAQAFGLIKSDAEMANLTEEAKTKQLEAQAVVLEDQHKTREGLKRFTIEDREHQEKGLTLSAREALIKENSARLHKEFAEGTFSELEAEEKLRDIYKEDDKLKEIGLQRKTLEQEKERTLLRLKLDQVEAQRKLSMDTKDLQNKEEDRSKTTLGELAELRAAKNTPHAFKNNSDEGLSDAARAAKATAREITDLQDQANELRLSGDVAGASALTDQIGTKKQSLVDSGFLKSTESDEFKAMKNTLHADNVKLAEIMEKTSETLEGKYVNQ